MEIELQNAIELTKGQAQVLDLHSFVNIFHVLIAELQLMSTQSGEWDGEVEKADELVTRIRNKGLNREWIVDLKTFQQSLRSRFDQLQSSGPAAPGLDESMHNISSLFEVALIRSEEYLARQATPGLWIQHSISQIVGNFTHFFAAVERNSKGRYRIIYNIAAQEEKDYVVNMKIESIQGDTVTMPAEFQDVFRDLIANARKYTKPGGVITAGLYEDDSGIRIVVEDNGMGIPEEELPRVVEFGYRASNVRHLPTMGGGFGLTKAYLLCRAYDGRMSIRSQVGVGTRITLNVPLPTESRV